MNQAGLLIILAVIVATAGWLVYRFNRRLSDQSDERKGIEGRLERLNEHNLQLTSTLRMLQESFDRRFSENTERIDKRLDGAARSYADVRDRIATLQESTKRLEDIGKNMSELQDILRAPKFRGSLGEIMLENILTEILPRDYFGLQHTFKNGECVDAVIKLKEGLISVDSKFPLENFQKMIKEKNDQSKKSFRRAFVGDVKKHVDAIAAKYIRADEGTLDFALMYIAAENVYYETIIKEDTAHSLWEYCSKKKVVPVSPNSFYAYLMTIVRGLQGLKIEKEAREIMNRLARLNAEFGKFYEEFNVLGTHITNTKNKYDSAERRLEKFGVRLEQIQSTHSDEVKLIE